VNKIGTVKGRKSEQKGHKTEHFLVFLSMNSVHCLWKMKCSDLWPWAKIRVDFQKFTTVHFTGDELHKKLYKC